MVCAAPLKITVLPAEAVKVPLFAQSPLTVRLLVPLMVREELAFIVIFLQYAVELITGLFVTFGIMTIHIRIWNYTSCPVGRSFPRLWCCLSRFRLKHCSQ